jgi:Flp pilus assembly protein TadG
MYPVQSHARRGKSRKGSIVVLAAFLSVVLVGMVAFCVDIGYVLSAKEELQRTADAAALATCWEFGQKLSEGYDSSVAAQLARGTAEQYAALNSITRQAPQIDTNTGNSPGGDVVFGYVNDFYNYSGSLNTTDPSSYNAVRVLVRRDATMNGQVPLFFARIFGIDGQSLQAEATAVIVRDVRGFRAPADGGNVDLLPFALDVDTWNDLANGGGQDHWRWNAETGAVEAGSDGIREVNLYPQGTGSPGNRGTVDIGSNNNSTSDISRQILHGVSPSDFAHHGGSLEFDSHGEMALNGDTGISAGVKDELAHIVGQPRTIPVFESVVGPGNNATYTIVKWVGIRIVDVKLTGSKNSKHVTIQHAPVVADGVIPSGESGTSSYVYSSAILVK